MNKIACTNCGFVNDETMNFCTSCGKLITSVAQSSVPTVAKLAIPQPKTEIQYPTIDQKRGSKARLGWFIGCFALLVVAGFIVVFVVTFWLSMRSNLGSNSSKVNERPPANANKKQTDSSSGDDSTNNKEEFEKDLLDILQDRKEAGKFKQLTANVVKKDDFFPLAIAAAQASYHNGSRYVTLSIGKFENFDDSKKNFDQQFANVKKKGGRTQILETSIDGTINGVYQAKNTFTAEYCTKSAFCYRMASADPKALKDFIENFIKL